MCRTTIMKMKSIALCKNISLRSIYVSTTPQVSLSLYLYLFAFFNFVAVVIYISFTYRGFDVSTQYRVIA